MNTKKTQERIKFLVQKTCEVCEKEKEKSGEKKLPPSGIFNFIF